MSKKLVPKHMDVEKIMKEIRKNISQKERRRDLESITSLGKTENNEYKIFSHRKLSGPFLIAGRRLVHEEVKRYVDPVFHKQNEFNLATTRILTELSTEMYKIKKQLDRER